MTLWENQYHMKYVCFDCRLTYNRKHRHCPKCKGFVQAIGKYFKPPKQNNDKEWEAIRILFDAGIRYAYSSGKAHSRLLDDYYKNPKQLSNAELLRILERASWLYECYVMKWVVGERPRHPRDARTYLASIEEKQQTMFDIVQSVANKLGRDHPQVQSTLAHLTKIQSENL